MTRHLAVLSFLALAISDLAATQVSRTAAVARVRPSQSASASASPRESFAAQPPAAWQDQDPADSLYRRARLLLNRSDYSGAAAVFRDIRNRYPRSAYAPDSYYWEALARYRIGSLQSLRTSRELLDEQARRHPGADTRDSGDARELQTRVDGELARLGDEAAARRVTEQATRAVAPQPAQPVQAPRPVRAPRAVASRQTRCDGEDDIQTAALNALLQMDSDRAIPILQKVLARRDPESLCLRRKAVFLVSQHEGQDAERMLLDAARSDPDPEVRHQAVFWLSQVDSPRAVVALDSILADARDPELQDKAVFALSQHHSPEARRALRRFAERRDVSSDLREKAVFWLGQSDDAENIEFLQAMYSRVSEEGLKERIIFSVSQSDRASSRWFADIARNQSEPLELRKKALFWMGQRDETSGADIAAIYGTFGDREIKEQLIFVLSQKDDRAAVDKLFEIARRDPDPELRKKAIFWLGQSKDPRASDLIAEILIKP